MRKSIFFCLLATLICLTATAPAGAVGVGDKVSIHGYGNWAYRVTDGNSYAGGNEEGTWDNMEFSLSVTANPVERLSIHAQPFWGMEEEGTEGSLDFAFVEYSFSPALAVRFGRVKQPFGIFTEIFDVGVLHPFTELPQGIYGPSGFVAEAYMGGGVTGAVDVSSNLRLQYDVYGGEIEADLIKSWEEDEEGTDLQDMVGGRLNLVTADSNISVGVSGYTGTEDTKSEGEESSERHSVVGADAEMIFSALTMRAEWAFQDTDSFSANAAYAEAEYLITPRWRVALRYDWTKVDPDEDEGVADELLESTDIGAALDYIVNPNFVVKLCYHNIDGNRFTTADEDTELEDATNLVTFGVSYSF